MNRKQFDKLRHRIIGICADYAPEMQEKINRDLKIVSVRIPLKKPMSDFDKKLVKAVNFNPKDEKRKN